MTAKYLAPALGLMVLGILAACSDLDDEAPSPSQGEMFAADPTTVRAENRDPFVITLTKVLKNRSEPGDATLTVWVRQTDEVVAAPEAGAIAPEAKGGVTFRGSEGVPDPTSPVQIQYEPSFRPETVGGQGQYLHTVRVTLACQVPGEAVVNFNFVAADGVTQSASTTVTCDVEPLEENNNPNNDPNGGEAGGELDLLPATQSSSPQQPAQIAIRRTLQDPDAQTIQGGSVDVELRYDSALLDEVTLEDINATVTNFAAPETGVVTYTHDSSRFEVDGSLPGHFFNEHTVTLRCLGDQNTTEVTVNLTDEAGTVLTDTAQVTCTGDEAEISLPEHALIDGAEPTPGVDGALRFEEFGVVRTDLETPRTGVYQIVAQGEFLDANQGSILIEGSSREVGDDGHSHAGARARAGSTHLSLTDAGEPRGVRQYLRPGPGPWNYKVILTVAPEHDYARGELIVNGAQLATLETDRLLTHDGTDVVLAGNQMSLRSLEMYLLLDGDGDGVDDEHDNCPGTANTQQLDVNGDGIGEACQDGVAALPDYTVISGNPTLNELGCLEALGETAVLAFETPADGATDFDITGVYFTDHATPTTVWLRMFDTGAGDGVGAVLDHSRDGHRAIVRDGPVNWAPGSLPPIWGPTVFQMRGTLSPTHGELSVNLDRAEFDTMVTSDMVVGEGTTTYLELTNASICGMSLTAR